MSTTFHYIFRSLKKANLLKHITFCQAIVFNKKKVTVLLRNEVGYPNLFLEEDFLIPLFTLFLPLKPGVFVDAGVNIGQTLIKLKTVDEDRPYVGFEPNEVCVNYTNELVRINQFKHCEIKPYALSDGRKKDRLALNEKTDAAASLVNGLRPGFFKDGIQINCVAFDEAGLTQPVSIIKIDVEGAELDVLRGMQTVINTFQPLIICEVLDSYNFDTLAFTQQRADSLCLLLKQHDYIIFKLYQQQNRIDRFERIESIRIQPWSLASYAMNDYLFCHVTFELGLIRLLNQLSSI